MEKKKNRNHRSIPYVMIYACFFAILMVCGAQLEERGSIRYADEKTWGSIVLLFLVGGAVVYGLFYLLAGYESARKNTWQECTQDGGALGQEETHKQKCADELLIKKATALVRETCLNRKFWIVSGIFLVCWFPYFLASFPGFFLYDAQTELNMVLTGEYTTHHPLAHVLLLGWVMKVIHKITGSYNAGIAVYVICQAVFIAMSFSYLLLRMKHWGVRKWIRILGMVYLCLFPVIPMYALCTTKDVLFTIFVILFLASLVDRQNYGNAALIVNGVLMLLFRNNGIYALVLSLPFLILSEKSNVQKRRLAVACGITLLAYATVSFGLKTVTNASDAPKQEMLSVPIQQLARVYCYEPESMSANQKVLLQEFVPEEALLRYRPTLSDPVKVAFNSEVYKERSDEFFSLWLAVAKKQPALYMDAFLVNNYGFWYPYASLNCYKGNQTYTYIYEDSSYFGYETEQPGERKSLFPALDEFVRKLSLEISWQKLPGIRMLFHPAYYVWIFLFGMCYQLSHKRYQMCAYAIPVLLLLVTVIPGPAVLTRYVLYFYFGFPLLLAFLLEGKLAEHELYMRNYETD